MQLALHTHPQSRNAHEHKSMKALAARLSTVHKTAAAMLPFWWNNAFFWVHLLFGLILAESLAERCGCFNDHVCVNGHWYRSHEIVLLGFSTNITFFSSWSKTNLAGWLFVTWGDAGNRIRKQALGWRQQQPLSKLHTDWHVVPASQQKATWLACSFHSAYQREPALSDVTWLTPPWELWGDPADD